MSSDEKPESDSELVIVEGTAVARSPERPTSSETAFIGKFSTGSRPEFDQGVIGNLLWPDPLPASVDSETSGTSDPQVVATRWRRRLQRRLVFAAAVLTLSLMIGASIYELRQLDADEGDEPPAAFEVRVRPVEPLVEPPVERPPKVEPAVTMLAPLPDRGRKFAALLAVSAQEVGADAQLVERELEGLIRPGKVTLVNLWATWCAPCKAELPGLKAMFERAQWGDAVRFLPIQVSDSRDPVWAHQQFSASMPATEHFLSDSLGGVLAALRGLEGAPTKAKKAKKTKKAKKAKKPASTEAGIELPVTLILDCRRHVRLVHHQALGEPELLQLQTMLGELRAELSQDYCTNLPTRPPRPPPVSAPETPPLAQPPPAQSPPAECGDGKCEGSETRDTCCDCLDCKKSERCVKPPHPAKPPSCLGKYKPRPKEG